MASPIIKIKRSSVQGKQPGVADLPLGELALNTYDGRLYVSKSTDSGVTTSIVNVSGIQIQDEGSAVGYANTINFVGSGVTVLSITNGVGIVSVSSGGGGGGASVSISTVAPSTPTAGDLWYNNNLGRTFIYYDEVAAGIGLTAVWVDAAPFNIPEPDSTPGKSSTTFTATEGQTSFTVSYSVGYIDVFLNGVRLNSAEFVENAGSSVILQEAASAGDVIDVVEYRMGIGATGPTGAAGPLSGVTSVTNDATYYPLIVTGTGSVNPYVSVATSYFNFNPSSGTLVVNQMSVVGVATARDFNSSSDRNLKENIQVIQNPIEKIQSIQGVSFDWKEVKQSSLGVIAQDVEKVLPELVSECDGKKAVNYNGLVGLLIEAVKTQQEQINTLRQEIEDLKK